MVAGLEITSPLPDHGGGRPVFQAKISWGTFGSGLIYLLLGLLLAVFCSGLASAQAPGADLFHKGQYTAAYAALWPGINAGNPEAAFYGLVIRRNGLDGRAAAKPDELAALWNVLQTNQDFMRQGLANPDTPQATADAYRTALAQLSYFGPTPPPWPPGRPGPEKADLVRAASTSLAPMLRRFPPAMNFQAYLELNTSGKRPSSAFWLVLRSAEKGDRLAMANLAWLYREGVGTEKNNLRASHWARQGAAAIPPVPRSLNELAYCYEMGIGVTKDLTEAARWYEKGAAQAYPQAQGNSRRLKKKGAGGTADNPVLESGLTF